MTPQQPPFGSGKVLIPAVMQNLADEGRANNPLDMV